MSNPFLQLQALSNDELLEFSTLLLFNYAEEKLKANGYPEPSNVHLMEFIRSAIPALIEGSSEVVVPKMTLVD